MARRPAQPWPTAEQLRLLLRLEIDAFNTRYAATLDRGDLRQWPLFFDEKPLYRIASRENFDAGLPVALIHCDSREMLEDRVFSVLNTLVYAPRTITHFVTNVDVLDETSESVAAEVNFLLVENLIDRNPRLLMAGRYIDRFTRASGRLALKERHCIYDTLTIQTSVVYPV
jgi:anthranilate 1,2-dioxygenase small subunit